MQAYASLYRIMQDNSSRWLKMIQNDSDVLIWFRMIQDDPKWSEMIRQDPWDLWWLKMIQDESKWSKIIPDDPRWSEFLQEDPKLSMMIKFDRLMIQNDLGGHEMMIQDVMWNSKMIQDDPGQPSVIEHACLGLWYLKCPSVTDRMRNGLIYRK